MFIVQDEALFDSGSRGDSAEQPNEPLENHGKPSYVLYCTYFTCCCHSSFSLKI